MGSDLLKRIDQAAASGDITADSPTNLKSWLTRESLAQYRPRITELIHAGEWQKLNEMFWTAIPFGTGGRRCKLDRQLPASRRFAGGQDALPTGRCRVPAGTAGVARVPSAGLRTAFCHAAVGCHTGAVSGAVRR